MAESVYVCCAIISSVCATLLIKSYLQTRIKILLWVALSFCFLAMNNIFVCFDLIVFPEVDMLGAITRNALLAIAGSVLAVGLVWEMS